MIGILILNYKKYQVTADCIRSVLDTGDGLDYHIYVLDNGSGNDSIACLQAQFPNNPRITWMESAENTGYARGNNQMLSRARKDGCTAAVITNSDIVFLPGTLQQLAADIAEGHPIVGPRLQYPNGQRQNSVKLRPYTYREYLWTETYLRNLVPKAKLQALRRQPAAPGEVYWLSGAVFAVALALIGIISTDFSKYFIVFHKIFFNNDLWVLDPRTDMLINIVPEGFFFDTAARIAMVFAGIVMVFFVGNLVLYKRAGR